MIKSRLKAYILEVLKEHFAKELRPRVIVADTWNNIWPTETNAIYLGDSQGFCAVVLLDGEEKTKTYNYNWIRFPKDRS